MMPLIRRCLFLIIGFGLAIAMSPFVSISSTERAADIIASNAIASDAIASDAIATVDSRARISEIEQTWKQQYEYYLGRRLSTPSLTADEIAEALDRLSSQTGKQLALIYVFPHPTALELVLVTPGIDPIRKTFPEIPEDQITEVARELQSRVTSPARGRGYLASAQQLYRWIIAPLEADLRAHEVDALVFCMGGGLRSLPIAALSDGQQFLTEHYSVGLIPAFNLINTRYQGVRETRVLAMGASEFPDMGELPAVPLELSAIANDIGSGEVFLNQEFTLSNLRQQLETGQFPIVHLATHAAFRSGTPDNSYIQLWQGDRLRLDEVRQLNWSELPVELLVLSACQTALGDRQAELGFAGLTFHSGVKSSLASLWRVSDLGTLALMREFYWQLSQPDITTKSEALRRAQLSLMSGQVRIQNAQLKGPSGTLPLSDELAQSAPLDFSDPYYWASFTLVGSPW
ncbi:MAG: CHAT domain-containing protein [Elainellaceae cyanobacterium]